MPTVADARLSSALRLAVARLHRRMRQERPDSMLSVSHLAAMSTLFRHGSMTLSELARHERVKPPSMTRMVAFLDETGLVARAADPEDGRQVVLCLTEAGRRLLDEDRKRRNAWLARRLRDLTADEIETLRAATPILERLAQS